MLEEQDSSIESRKRKTRIIQGLSWGSYGDDANSWDYNLEFFTWLSSKNDAFLPLLHLMQAIVNSPYPTAGLYGRTSMHDILLGRSADIFANPHLRISYDFKNLFTLTYQDFTKEPWTRTCTTEEVWTVLERFLLKRARWFREIHSLANHSED